MLNVFKFIVKIHTHPIIQESLTCKIDTGGILYSIDKCNPLAIYNKATPVKYISNKCNPLKIYNKPAAIKYFPSMFDPLAIKKYPKLYEIKGFIKNHESCSIKKLSSKLFFGNFSIGTINGRLERDTLEEKQEKMILKLIDSHHPSILLLQSMSKDVIRNIEINSGPHYKMCADRYVDVDRVSMKKEYKPIIYDTNVVEVENEGNFAPPLAEETSSYATFATFRKIGTNTRFTVINVDFYSADGQTIETQLFTIMKHIHDSWISKYPIIIGGTVNAITGLTKKLMSDAFKDLVKSDRNNYKMSGDTFHDNGKFYDGITRDFLLLKDERHKFIINYVRVLKSFDIESFKHYPIYAILTINK